jgi:SAM-dependent methyltransferase
MNIRDKWNTRYEQVSADPQAAQVLQENQHLLPESGTALDLACGRGGNAILLANHGLQVDAVDISDVAINALAEMAKARDLDIHAQVRDVEKLPLEAARYDVVVVSYFLHRPLFPALIETLGPGGLLYYQTFMRNSVSERGPRSANYRLADQELLQLLPGLDLVVYREEGRVGDCTQGFRDEVMYVGMKDK